MTAVTIRKLDRAPNTRLKQNPTFFPKILIVGRLSYLTVNPSTISIFFISSTFLERIFNRHVPGMDASTSRENGLPCPGSEKGLPVIHNPRSALQRRSCLRPILFKERLSWVPSIPRNCQVPENKLWSLCPEQTSRMAFPSMTGSLGHTTTYHIFTRGDQVRTNDKPDTHLCADKHTLFQMQCNYICKSFGVDVGFIEAVQVPL